MTAFNSIGPNLQIHSLVRGDGELELSLQEAPVPPPGPDQVIVRIEATPINPSDMGTLFGAADLSTIVAVGSNEHPIIKATVPAALLPIMAGRLDQSLVSGNEGAGVVVAAGGSAAAQALLGKTVAVLRDGAVHARYGVFASADCLVLPAGATPEQGASAYVNPMTVLGMVETMRREGHAAIVHTAAASNLGQMLNRVCLKDGVGLVNVVRSSDHSEILERAGARFIVDSSSPTFREDLIAAIAETGATLGFDATGGGGLASEIFFCMEQVALRKAARFSRYGSSVHKQVYIYGSLEPGPTILTRNFGTAFSLGGWLMSNFVMSAGADTVHRLKKRVADELTTTFASHYTRRISLAEALQPDVIAGYAKRATGEKYLICPQL